MRSHGLSWVEIAKALGEPKINFIIKKMFARSYSYFFSRMDVFSFLLIHTFKKVFGHRYSCFILATGWSMFHIRRYRVIKGVSYDFTCNTFRRGLDFNNMETSHLSWNGKKKALWKKGARYARADGYSGWNKVQKCECRHHYDRGWISGSISLL